MPRMPILKPKSLCRAGVKVMIRSLDFIPRETEMIEGL
jgi:hypothetical protein